MKSILSFFIVSRNSFEGQEKGEKVILLLRRHPFVILIRLFFFLLLVLVPPVLGMLFSFFLNSYGLLPLFFFLSSVWYLFLWSAIFYSVTMYTLDVWIVTDRRIIDSTQHGFFSRIVSELHLSRIQDMSVDTEGVIPTFLKFGDLQIQTAGTEEKFRFRQIPNPEKVKDEIAKLASSQS
ncbi:MAG TPA: PH domain-containing protein [Candidatus Paceibacterota bacterium]|nr:PH domain-containing protein [Candidatus Paceibacterota bacterium]